MSRRFVLLMLLPLGCFAERDRPGPVDAIGSADLAVRVLAPVTGATVVTGRDIIVRVEGRDRNLLNLYGVGFVARRDAPGLPRVDSAAIRFAPRADTVHEFTFQVPDTYPTNSRVIVYGMAFGPGTTTQLSPASFLAVIQCASGVCP